MKSGDLVIATDEACAKYPNMANAAWILTEVGPERCRAELISWTGKPTNLFIVGVVYSIPTWGVRVLA